MTALRHHGSLCGGAAAPAGTGAVDVEAMVWSLTVILLLLLLRWVVRAARISP
jgi:hypothetical protein